MHSSHKNLPSGKKNLWPKGSHISSKLKWMKEKSKFDEMAREKEKVVRVIWLFDMWDPHDDSHPSL